MSDFHLYFSMGREHILDWQGYDHILFIATLCGIYLLPDWRKVLLLVTAFTIGHSITLALSVFNWVHISSRWVEFLIPVTIVCTALSNLSKKPQNAFHTRWIYAMALFFGLIHGLGFSNYLKSLLGKDSSILTQLFAFNLGLEFGQLFIVIILLALAQVIIGWFKVPRREWIIFLSAATFGVALLLSIQRFVLL